MTDSSRTSELTGVPTPVDDGTPAGHPTPAGEPISTDQADLFPGTEPNPSATAAKQALLAAIGRVILAWGQLERTTADKVAVMRKSFGDVRAVGGRTRPTMQKLLAELRALVAMRDRHDKQALSIIAEIDGGLQRTAQFRQLLIDGAQSTTSEVLHCRDMRNSDVEISLKEIENAADRIDRICAQIAAL